MLRSPRQNAVCYVLIAALLSLRKNGGSPFSNCQALSSISMPPMTTTGEHLPLARKAMEYFDRSSDPFHAVQTSIDLLKEAGFEELDETGGTIDVSPGGKYYYTRNKSSLVAFAIGKKYKPGTGGFKIIGGHTDSPNLRVKPRSKRSAKTAKSIQIGAECYGGGLWHTWFDRDLGLSGRVFCRHKEGDSEFISQRLVKVGEFVRISFLQRLYAPSSSVILRNSESSCICSGSQMDQYLLISVSLVSCVDRSSNIAGTNIGNTFGNCRRT